MGGLVLDIWIAFLVRTTVNGFRRLRSRKWPEVSATVFNACTGVSGGFGCAVSTVSYHYRVGGEKHSGTHDEPCISRSSADYFVRDFPKGKEITVRVDPGAPSRSVALI
jgi:ribosomal protein L6P/L9E